MAGMSSDRSCFHSTSETGLAKIRATGCIRMGSKQKNHHHFGRGVYFSSKHPSEGQRIIAQNNWTQHGGHYIINGKVAIAIEVELPFDKVKEVGKTFGRDILLHDGPVKLNQYRWRVWRIPFDTVHDGSLAPLETHEPRGGYYHHHGHVW
ncbi:uncharacterized protein [Littorina saxatilis]|uniref:Uncharacterized protein n=1 Tax=Littorina saxatilis TaxID=31220 RepID=A0AAN9GJJ7_9CAEN